jgi:aspartyl-tRNA(Asn)/glutamyl-tRNA(Gln) amidotransferase subunit B
MNYEIVVGLEVHAQLRCESKMFCACANRFGADPNTLACPVCAGLPGSLPVPNRRAFELGIRAALALSCRIAARTRFDRKNYFYPDLPKNYQISQFEDPLGAGGRMTLGAGVESREIRIRRVHLEEDAGKSLRDAGETGSRLDFNRAGIPLIEIVTEPDFRHPAEVRSFLRALRRLLRYLGVSDGNMEEGSLRAEPNISLRPAGTSLLGVKTEIKNLNSFRAVQRALEFEAARHARLLDAGEEILPETRTWDPDAGETRVLRSKEEARDYRFFPEPDLPPLRIDPAWVERIRAALPETPRERFERFRRDLDLPDAEAAVLTDDRAFADFFESVLEAAPDALGTSRFLVKEVRGALSEIGAPIDRVPLSAKDVALLLDWQARGEMNALQARECLREMARTGRDADAVRRERGLVQIRDAGRIEAAVRRAVEGNPGMVADYRAGRKKRAVGYFMGVIMRETGGKADPKQARERLEGVLEEEAGKNGSDGTGSPPPRKR